LPATSSSQVRTYSLSARVRGGHEQPQRVDDSCRGPPCKVKGFWLLGIRCRLQV
jgi:hypothetical protein